MSELDGDVERIPSGVEQAFQGYKLNVPYCHLILKQAILDSAPELMVRYNRSPDDGRMHIKAMTKTFKASVWLVRASLFGTWGWHNRQGYECEGNGAHALAFILNSYLESKGVRTT